MQFDNYSRLILDTLNAAGCPLKGIARKPARRTGLLVMRKNSFREEDISLPQEERYVCLSRNSESGRQAGSFGHHRRSFIGKEIIYRDLYVESFIYSRS